MKKVLTLCVISLFGLCLVGCNRSIKDSLKWDNENALYAFVNSKYENDILKDVEGAFQTLNFERVYVARKYNDADASLALLFILKSNETNDVEEFRQSLLNDSRISYVSNCYDLPFESIDDRYIECEKKVIEVDEIVKLELKGSKKVYMESFSFNGFLVKPKQTDKKYKTKDFSQINLKKIEELENGWLYFEINTKDYFSLVKAMDKVARLDSIEEVDVDRSEITLIPPSSWVSSNTKIVDIIEKDENGYAIVKIKGISKGKAMIEFDGIACEIIVS